MTFRITYRVSGHDYSDERTLEVEGVWTDVLKEVQSLEEYQNGVSSNTVLKVEVV